MNKKGRKQFFLLFLFLLMSCVTVSAEDEFLPSFIFVHTDVNITSLGSGTWYNITFYDEIASPKSRITHTYDDETNHTFTIVDDGYYNLDYYLSFLDIAPAPNGHIAARVILNGVEVNGSLREQDTTKQNADTLVGHGNILMNLSAGDVLSVQFATDDTTISLASHATYGVHKDTAIVTIERVAISEQSYDDTFWFYIFMFLIPVILIIISRITEDKWFVVFAGIILVCFGIYLQANGLPYFDNDVVETAIWSITLCVGLYFMISNSIKLAEEGGL